MNSTDDHDERLDDDYDWWDYDNRYSVDYVYDDDYHDLFRNFRYFRDCDNWLEVWDQGYGYDGWPLYSYDVIVACVVFNGLAFLLCFYAIVAMVRHKETRENSFNLYVVFLLLPDALYNLQMCILGIERTRYCSDKRNFNRSPISQVMFLSVFFSNLFLNCVLAYEVHSLLDRSHRGIRTGAPPLKRTFVKVAVAYTLAVLLAVITEFLLGTWLIIWGVITGMCFVCLVFVIAIRIRIWRKGLIPRQGRTRVITLFFERIILVFLVIYVPTTVWWMVSMFMHYDEFWTIQPFFIIASLQVLVTLGLVVQKPDIAKAVFCGRDGFCERKGNIPRWSVFQTKSRQWCCGWFNNDNTNHRTIVQTANQTAVMATSEWAMDDVYDDHPSSADGNVEDGNVEDGDAVEDDAEASPQTSPADGNVEDGDSGEREQ